MIFINSNNPLLHVIEKRIKCSYTRKDFSLVDNVNSYNQSPDLFIAINSDDYGLLVAKGLSERKIVPYYLYKDSSFDNPLSYFNKSIKYDALFMGMSHSQCSIDLSKLSMNYLMMSRPSMDLFCHLGYLKKIYSLLSNPDSIRQIVLEIPYYIFNYDLSQFGDFVYTKLNYFKILDDYHNFAKRENAPLLINQFENYQNLFSELNLQSPPIQSLLKSFALKCGMGRLIDFIKIVKNNDSVWSKRFPETIDENIRLFDQIVCFVKENFSNAVLVVLVMPFNPIFFASHRKSCDKAKKMFYEILNRYENLNLIDDFRLYKSPFLFRDHCHMGREGGLIYSCHLDAELSRFA